MSQFQIQHVSRQVVSRCDAKLTAFCLWHFQGLFPPVPPEQRHQFPGGLRHLLGAGLHGWGAGRGHIHRGPVRWNGGAWWGRSEAIGKLYLIINIFNGPGYRHTVAETVNAGVPNWSKGPVMLRWSKRQANETQVWWYSVFVLIVKQLKPEISYSLSHRAPLLSKKRFICINPRLKIVPNKCTVYPCLSDVCYKLQPLGKFIWNIIQYMWPVCKDLHLQLE